MPNDKDKTDERDRSKVAGGEDYEVHFLAEKEGISTEQAKKLIRRHGNDREMIEAAIRKMKGGE